MTQIQRVTKSLDFVPLPRASTITDQMFKELTNLFRRFIDFEDVPFYTLSVIYVLLTHVYDIFDETPYLQIFGLKGSGKSRYGDLFEGLCFNPFNSSEITDASLYRAIGQESSGVTMIIDEADDLSSSTQHGTLLRILRSGYRRNGNVSRCGPDGRPEQFSTFCPKIIINERGIEDSALESRTIPIQMIKSVRCLEKFQFSKIGKEFKKARELIRLFCEEYRDLLLDRYGSFEGVDGISGRDEEIWAPIIIIADLLTTLLDKPSIKEKIAGLAKGTILERKRKQLIGNRDLQILESTRAFAEQEKPLNGGGLFVAEDLRDFTKERWGMTGLSTEAVARTLNRYRIIKEVKRSRLNDSEGGLVKKVQKSCYLFNREILLKLTNEYFEGGENL
jgi:hypothetical protein